ncbi:MAG TPA: hypothetical protein VF820_00175 [Patescibacteria group bacterium]
MADCSSAPICGNNDCPATIQCLVGGNGTVGLFANIIHGSLIFVGSVTVILIIFSGYKFMMSGGDAKQVEGARKTFTFAIVGLLVVLFSFFLLNIIGSITGVPCIGQFSFTACQ